MALWRFYDYSLVGAPGPSEIDDWLRGRANYIIGLEAVLTQIANWPLAKLNKEAKGANPPFRWLEQGPNRGLSLGELRYDVYGRGGPTQRPICWIPKEGQCILLVGMEKITKPGQKKATYTPRQAERTARNRRDECKAGLAYLIERTIP